VHTSSEKLSGYLENPCTFNRNDKATPGFAYSAHTYLSLRAAVYRVGKGKIEVKVTIAQVTKAQRGSRGMALLFL